MNSINTTEYNAYYKPYLDALDNDLGIVEGLNQNLDTVVSFFSNIPVEKHNYAYDEGKWTIKDVLIHIIDTERIFAYRALRIAREDKTPLAGFEQDDYVLHAFAENRSMDSLLEEFGAVRRATITLFTTFNEQTLLRIGEASGFPVSVRAIGYIIRGHENHHVKIIKERYL
ncbi:DinB family protein [Winogradskyella psychrotolerans]|uniref:DinB family protein n=1 Tax=Winogradskyella psychrotolerans TaxID=1344585 RepID=UPI001C079B33|nr:DinB family protein [Winogradskyella psychrotolerans]MBU2930108.1 DinB family protein [Winogradskyella psychrotolerans]